MDGSNGEGEEEKQTQNTEENILLQSSVQSAALTVRTTKLCVCVFV